MTFLLLQSFELGEFLEKKGFILMIQGLHDMLLPFDEAFHRGIEPRKIGVEERIGTIDPVQWT